MILFTQWARNIVLIASFAIGLFNAALRALLIFTSRSTRSIDAMDLFPLRSQAIYYASVCHYSYANFTVFCVRTLMENDASAGYLEGGAYHCALKIFKYNNINTHLNLAGNDFVM